MGPPLASVFFMYVKTLDTFFLGGRGLAPEPSSLAGSFKMAWNRSCLCTEVGGSALILALPGLSAKRSRCGHKHNVFSQLTVSLEPSEVSFVTKIVSL